MKPNEEKGDNSKQRNATNNNKGSDKKVKKTKSNHTTANLRTNKRNTGKKIKSKNQDQIIKKLSIYEKLFNAQQTAGAVLKTGENTHHKYSYAKELDIIAEAKPVLKEQRLTYTFTTLKAVTSDTDAKKRRLEVRFTLINVDNPSETIVTDMVSEGENKDGSVVGIPVAYTMALKYFLAKILLLETGNDAEIQKLDEKKNKESNKKTEDKDPNEEYAKSMRLIKSTRNVDGLIEFSEKVKNGKFFNEKQKEDLIVCINARVDELTNES